MIAGSKQALDLVADIGPLLRQRDSRLQRTPVQPTLRDLSHIESVLGLLGEGALQLGVYLDAEEAAADLGVAVREGDGAHSRLEAQCDSGSDADEQLSRKPAREWGA